MLLLSPLCLCASVFADLHDSAFTHLCASVFVYFHNSAFAYLCASVFAYLHDSAFTYLYASVFAYLHAPAFTYLRASVLAPSCPHPPLCSLLQEQLFYLFFPDSGKDCMPVGRIVGCGAGKQAVYQVGHFVIA